MKTFAHRLAQIRGQISLHAVGFYPFLYTIPPPGYGAQGKEVVSFAPAIGEGTLPLLYAFGHSCVEEPEMSGFRFGDLNLGFPTGKQMRKTTYYDVISGRK